MIILAGKNNIAVYALDLLTKKYDKNEIKVITNETDFGTDTWQRSLKKRAYELNIEEVLLDKLSLSDKDIFISLEFDKIISPKKLNTSNLYNIHFSKLPLYKGMYTSVFPILNGEKESGVTLHKIEQGIDTGDIYLQDIFSISDEDRSQDLYSKYIDSAMLLISSNLDDLVSNKLKGYSQPKLNSTYYSKNSLDFSKLSIDFNQTAWQIQRYIYAFSFRVYQLVPFGNHYISSAIISDKKSTKKPGSIISENNDYIEISTIDYNIILFFDRLNEYLPKLANCSVDEFKSYELSLCGVNDKNHFGWSPIIVAAYHGNVKLIDYLLTKGAKINDVNYKGTSVLMYAKDYCLKNKDREFFDYLISLGADISHRDFSNKNIEDYLNDNEKYFLNF